MRSVRILRAAGKSPAARASLAFWMRAFCGAGSVSGWEKSWARRGGARRIAAIRLSVRRGELNRLWDMVDAVFLEF